MVFILAKRLSEKQKNEIVKLFISGINIERLSKQFLCSKLTISRNLKKSLGETNYKELSLKSKSTKNLKDDKNQKKDFLKQNKIDMKINDNHKKTQKMPNKKVEEEFFELTQFIEVTPLNYDIENSVQKDLSSIPISEIDFPKTVFMIVDNKVELEIKNLKDYPKWQFLSQDELNRKTIEIFLDLKIAKSFCGKDQKVIKVPNTDVFKLVAPILRSRGISRIISSDKLIAI
tara:strand:+ start:161 stop:853 length:693 start_codon:yes stop_codon:yes gene_type:complete